jgi:quercetin dioxygenase-like cupin family protein
MPDGTTFVILESGSEREGAQMTFEITMAPDALGPPRHLHPAQEESWTVQSGELAVLVGGQWRTLIAGESLTIPPGTVHTIANRSTAAVRVHDTHRPALDFQEYIEDLDMLTRSGKLSARVTPRTLIYGSMVLAAHRPMQLTANPAQRGAESILASIGRLLGHRIATR